MSDQAARERRVGDSLSAVLGDLAGATGYERYQLSDAGPPAGAMAHTRARTTPTAFPVPQRNDSFVERARGCSTPSKETTAGSLKNCPMPHLRASRIGTT